MERLREDGIVAASDGSVRGTQSFVHTMSEVWSRPSLTGLEVAWRWALGIPTLLLLWRIGTRIVAEAPLNVAALRAMTVMKPLEASETIAVAMGILLPPLSRVAVWLVPLLAVAWVVWSSLGRTVVLKRVDESLQARPLTLMVLQAIRLAALAVSFVAWFLCLEWSAGVTVTVPISRGAEPNLVGYFALAIVSTLGLFTLWAVVSWALSVAPLLAMLRNLGPGASLTAAFRLGPLKSKLVEINLVMGIVKIALIVLAMVFTAIPLPFQSVATPELMLWWYVGVGVLYLLASDYFHVARLVGYLRLWRAYELPTESNRSA